MTSNRIDTVDEYFVKVTRVNSWSNILFWFSVICSFLVFFSSTLTSLNYILNIIFIISTILFFAINNWLSLFLLREAQSKRRTHLLTDSLGIRLDDEETNLYYNNSQTPSVLRLGVNVFENTLFTWKVTEEMARGQRIKGFLYAVIWLTIVLNRSVDLNFIAIVAQTLFASGIIVNIIKLEVLRVTCKQLFNEFRQYFLTNGTSYNDKTDAAILNLVFRYETLVASMGVHLSSETFNPINARVSEEWEKVKRNLNL